MLGITLPSELMHPSKPRKKRLVKAGTELLCPYCSEPAVRMLADVFEGEPIDIEQVQSIRGKPFAEGEPPVCRVCNSAFMMVRGDGGLAIHTAGGWIPYDCRH